MRRNLRDFAVAILTLVLVGLSAGSSAAQDASKPKPPVSMGGFTYKYVPTGRVHSFVCEVKACVPGSKVSYQLYPPDNDLDFEKFKLSQEMVASYFKKHAPKGTTIEFGTPRRTVNELYTAFENTREQQLPDGSKLFTKSMMLRLKAVSISLISSSQDNAAAEANRDVFLVGLLAWGETLKQGPSEQGPPEQGSN